MLGFRQANGLFFPQAAGYDTLGLPLEVKVAPTRPAVVYFFPARLASSRAVLARLEELRLSFSGRIGFVAVTADLHEDARACVGGLSLSLPLLSECGNGPEFGVARAPGFVVVAPGGKVLAWREGPFDWSSEEGRAFLEEIISLYAETPPELFGMPAAAPRSPGIPAPGAALVAVLPAATPAPLAAAPLAAAAADPARDLRPPAWLSPLEAAVVAELNLARTDPAGYSELLREYRGRINGTLLQQAGRMTVRLQEGRAAVDEAISFLSRQAPLPALESSKGLSLAARDLSLDQGRTGGAGHEGSDGSTPFLRMDRYGAWGGTAGENCSYGPDTAREIVIALVVDDGVPSRGHRANIYSRDFLKVGVSVGAHPVYGAVCVQDFAWSYRER